MTVMVSSASITPRCFFRASLVDDVLGLEGELDLATVPDLELALARAEEHLGAATLTVDLRGLEFMDCAGLRVLVATAERARRARRGFEITGGAGAVARLLRLCGLGDAQSPPPLETRAVADGDAGSARRVMPSRAAPRYPVDTRAGSAGVGSSGHASGP